MIEQIQLDEDSFAPELAEGDNFHALSDDLAYRRLVMVNIIMVGKAKGSDWFLVDTGIPGSAPWIRSPAAARFPNAKPKFILLTHGHFDHVGALLNLANEWDVPVYSHHLEAPYLNGTKSYAPPDLLADGGVMPSLSFLFPRGPVDIKTRLKILPEDGSVPGFSEWKWIHTPGHTEGHISLFRQSDGTLIAGDAVITTRQESAYAIAMQSPELHGPPRYFTPDWNSARESVKKIAALKPSLLISGHGRAMEGETMRRALQLLADRFDEIAVPEHLKY